MHDPYTGEPKRRSLSNQHNIDSDFMLHTRRRSTDHPVERLRKRSSMFGPPRLSSLSPTITDDSLALVPQRSASSSSNKSLSDHLAFLRFPSRSKRSSTQASSSPTAVTAVPQDLSDLPADRVALEGRINYHISRLDRLKRRLADLNAALGAETQEYALSSANLRQMGMASSVKDLNEQLQWLRECRDGLKPSVAFHRGELERIGRKRVQMDTGDGYEAALPAVYAGLDGDEVWEGRFAG